MGSRCHQQDPPFFAEALHSEEEHHYYDDASTTCSIKCRGETPEPFPALSDDEELNSLLSKEQTIDFDENMCLSEARAEAVEWVIRVFRHHSFSALTAVLAVNYLDRFLCSFQSHMNKPWMAHLAAVACLSLAAKVEETRVPLLVDLQVEESKFVFESKTIQRMELLVLSTLEWKLNPVTPLSFLDCIAKKLALKGHIRREFLRRCNSLILSIVHDCRFMCYLPSAMATATMLCVLSSLQPCGFVKYQDQLTSILGIDKDKVEGCYELIQEVIKFDSSIKKRKFGSLPKSPKGFFDPDSSVDSWALSSTPSSPETPSKKINS